MNLLSTLTIEGMNREEKYRYIMITISNTYEYRQYSIEDIYQPEQDKRRVVISLPGSMGTTILFARASKSVA